MKKQFSAAAFLSLCLAAGLYAQESGAPEADPKWNHASYRPAVAKYNESVEAAVNVLVDRMKIAGIGFRRPDRDSFLEELQNAILALSSVLKEYDAAAAGFEKPRNTPEEVAQATLKQTVALLKTLNYSIGGKILQAVNYCRPHDVAKRAHAVKTIVLELNVDGHPWTERLNRFDERYGRFVKAVAEMVQNDVKDLMGTEILTYSGLDKPYCDEDMRLTAYSANQLTILDNFLHRIRDDVLKELRNDLEYLRDIAKEGDDAWRKGLDLFEGKEGRTMITSDFELVKKLHSAFAGLLTELHDSIDDAVKYIDKAEDRSTVAGKLRSCTGFAPNKSVTEKAASGGEPHYRERVEDALAYLKGFYLRQVSQKLNILRIWR